MMNDVSELILRWQATIAGNPVLCQKVGAIIKIIIDGRGGGTWIFDCKSSGQVYQSDDAHADCTVKISFEDLRAIVSGKLNPQVAFLQGNLKLEGDFEAALTLHELLLALL